MSNTDESDENSENIHLLTFQLPIYITCNRRMRLLGYKKGNLSVIKSLRSTVTKSHSSLRCRCRPLRVAKPRARGEPFGRLKCEMV